MKLYKQIICTVFIILAGTAVFASEVGDKVYMEVEIDGDKVGKWVTFSAIKEYDINGSIIYRNYFNENTGDCSEIWFELKYDKNNNLIYQEDSEGTEEWLEYDKNGNMIHSKQSTGAEFWREYDSKGNCIHEERPDGIESCMEYDSKGNRIYEKSSDGYEVWYKYDKTGNTRIIEISSGYVYIDKYEFYEDGKTPKKIMTYVYNKH